MGTKLIDEYPLIVLPSLVGAVGIERAVILQQVHFLTNTPRSGVTLDGERWVYNTYAQWREYFPFWGEDSVRRHFKLLEDEGLLLSCQPNKEKWDRTKFYRVDLAAVAEAVARVTEANPIPMCERISASERSLVSASLKEQRLLTETPEEEELFSKENNMSADSPILPESPKESHDQDLPKPSSVTVKEKRQNDIEHIYCFWREVMGKNAATRLSPNRKRKIAARLREGYEVEQIRQAILGCSWSGFHMGDNESGTLYNDIELICRNSEKVERFIEIYQRVQAGQNVKHPVAPKQPSLLDVENDEWEALDEDQWKVAVELQENMNEADYRDRIKYEDFKTVWLDSRPQDKETIEEYERSERFRERFPQSGQAVSG